MTSLTLSLRARGAAVVLDLEADDLRALPLDDLGADAVVLPVPARPAPSRPAIVGAAA
jgi:hypothetical protein